MSLTISPAVRAATFIVTPKHPGERAKTGVGFVIHSDENITLALTAFHTVREKVKYQATFADQRKADLHFQAAKYRGDFALASMKTKDVGKLINPLQLTRQIPALSSTVLCVGFPDYQQTREFGGHLVRNDLPEGWIDPIEATMIAYRAAFDVEVTPPLPPGFSGGPFMFKDKVIGIISYTEIVNKSLYPVPVSHGPSAAQALDALNNWGKGMFSYWDSVRGMIDPSIKAALLQITGK